ncbi:MULTISPECIES: hypothetical protein [Cyanophyceae]|uniref:hypothetical protein n=1 Tax=Cyanophyceae TaxID=3028117 RepID=UPI0016895593|nr:hypothetical protein [Trichocoleus sp. FACHB-40]MBD2006333.1 hypothetical protein [Trichocoleus sp. FACHB-40]
MISSNRLTVIQPKSLRATKKELLLQVGALEGALNSLSIAHQEQATKIQRQFARDTKALRQQIQFLRDSIAHPGGELAPDVAQQAQEVTPEIEININVVPSGAYRAWCGTTLIGTFYHYFNPKRWEAESCYGTTIGVCYYNCDLEKWEGRSSYSFIPHYGTYKQAQKYVIRTYICQTICLAAITQSTEEQKFMPLIKEYIRHAAQL